MRTPTRSIPRRALTGATLGAVAALAACTSGSADSATAVAPSTVYVTVRPSSGPTAPPAATTGSTPGSTSGSTPDTASMCVASALHPAVAGSSGAAGTTGLTISLTNTGARPCTLTGYPGVSLVHAGVQVGSAADRETGPTPTVTIPAGGHTTFALLVGNALNYPTDACAPVAADGFRIYPPGSRAAIFLADPGFMACSTTDIVFMRVRPVGSSLD